MLAQKFLRDFLILWATIDPISTMLIFSGITAELTDQAKRRTALRAVLFAGLVLLGSILLGQFVLAGMGISMLAFQVAGGIVLFLFALQLIFGNFTSESDKRLSPDQDLAVYPLDFPSIATPGAILAVILLTDNHLYSLPTQLGTTAIVLFILLVTYLLTRRASQILKRLSPAGAELMVRIMGLILAALSVQLIFDAVVLFLENA